MRFVAGAFNMATKAELAVDAALEADDLTTVDSLGPTRAEMSPVSVSQPLGTFSLSEESPMGNMSVGIAYFCTFHLLTYGQCQRPIGSNM